MEKIRKLSTPKKVIVVVLTICLIAFIKWYMFPVVRSGVDEAGIKWEFHTFTGTLTFQKTSKSNGKMQDYYTWDNPELDHFPPWWEYHKRCRKVIFGPGITYIGSCTCKEYEHLSSIVFSDDVKKIGEYAFYYCKRLKRLECPKNLRDIGVAAFQGCGLQDVTLNEGLQNIYAYAFQKTEMKYIQIPDTVVQICKEAFADSRYLREVILPKSLYILGENAFCDDINLRHIRVETTKLWPEQAFFNGIGTNAVIEVPKEKYEEYCKKLETARVVAY